MTDVPINSLRISNLPQFFIDNRQQIDGVGSGCITEHFRISRGNDGVRLLTIELLMKYYT